MNLFIATGVFLFFLLLLLLLMRGHRYVRFLKDIPPATTFPPVSIVVPARNEERNIEEALASLLAQDYPALEIIVVDDRSTDRTGDILDRMQAGRPAFQVVHVTELPTGWLGKNHALFLGASQAGGDYLLFTDADVVMERSAVTRAVGQMVRTGIDHLAAGPEVAMRGTVLNVFAAGFMVFFTIYARPWSVENPRSASHIGIGAFNLVRRSAYLAAGTHRAIAMRPDDDMKLGKLLKKKGFRQQLVLGKGMLSVEWYGSVGEVVRGLEKNSFAGVEYSWAALIGGSLAIFLAFFWPFVGVWAASGAARLLYAGSIALLGAVSFYSAHLYGLRFRYFIPFPMATLLFLFILWRSALVTWKNGGIDWRGTHYSLKDLKANRI